jgi:hypothetical protein
LRFGGELYFFGSMNKNKANLPCDCDFRLISEYWSTGVLVAKPATLSQHSHTPSLHYSMIDRHWDFRSPPVYLIIGYSSVILWKSLTFPFPPFPAFVKLLLTAFMLTFEKTIC